MDDSLIARGPRRAPESKEGYEPGRLRRAAVLAVTELGPGLYRVKGQDEDYYDVAIHEDVPCYCRDAEFHGKGCKHFLAARLQWGDQELRLALGLMLVEAEKRNQALQRIRRKAS